MALKAIHMDPAAGPNAYLLSVLNQYRQLRQAQGQGHSVQALNKVIGALSQISYPITSSQQVKNIKGIGAKSLKAIDEILTTGTLEVLKESSITGSSINIATQSLQPTPAPEAPWKLFEQIHGVGPVKAKQWYDQGYRTLEQLPVQEMTREQQIGYQYLAEYSQRIPREEIEVCNIALDTYLKPYGIYHEIAGSFRRGREASGDIDVLVIYKAEKWPSLRTFIDTILACPIFTHILKSGDKKSLTLGWLGTVHRRIDVEVVRPEEYPYAIVYFTGPMELNTMMRDEAKRRHQTLNEKGLFYSEDYTWSSLEDFLSFVQKYPSVVQSLSPGQTRSLPLTYSIAVSDAMGQPTIQSYDLTLTVSKAEALSYSISPEWDTLKLYPGTIKAKQLLIPAKDEAQVFANLGYQYLTPVQRDQYAQKK